MDQLTSALSTYAATLSYDELTPDAIHGMKRCLVDSLACAVGGMDGQPCQIARALSRESTSSTPAQVLFTGEATTLEQATFVNSLFIRYLDCNDTYRVREGGHPSDAIPAVLAAADARHLSGKDALLGLVVAYEVFAALSAAEALGPRGIDHCAHTAAAAALGAGKVMGLDSTQMANALSIALVSNVSLRAAREGRLSMWKGAAGPNAARNGLFAARLAALGMEGPEKPFSGPSGMSRLLGEEPAIPELGGRGAPFHTGLTNMKFFPAEYHSQAPIWAALELRETLAATEIAAISIFTYQFAYHEIGSGEEKWHVEDRETADHSLPYLVSRALLDGDIGPQQFTMEKILERGAHELMARITVHEDPALTAEYPRVIATRMEAVANNGAKHSIQVRYPKGHVENPLSQEELNVKFARFAGGLMPEKQQRSALERVWQFEQTTDVSEVLAAFQL